RSLPSARTKPRKVTARPISCSTSETPLYYQVNRKERRGQDDPISQRDHTIRQQGPVLGRREKAAGEARDETTPRNGSPDQGHLCGSQEDLERDPDLGHVRPTL